MGIHLVGDDVPAERVLDSIFAKQLKLSAKIAAVAREAAFRDLPLNERRTYLALATKAVIAEEMENPS